MAWQLIYTSAPRLLEAGRSGFGTVARHRQISPLLVSTIERSSQFARLPGLGAERVIYCHRIVAVAGGRFHVLSCIRDAGADYTGRTNHLAHHLIAEQREVAALSPRGPSPADVLLAMSWAASWEEAPRFLEAADEIALANFAPQSVNEWARVTGDANHAWLLANGEASRGAFLLCPPNTDARALFATSLRLAPDRLWQVPFTTALQPSDEPSDFRWIALEAESTLRAQAESSTRPILDLTRPETLPAPEVPANAAISGIPRPTALGTWTHRVEKTIPPPRASTAKTARILPAKKSGNKKWAIVGGAAVIVAALAAFGAHHLISARSATDARRTALQNRLAALRVFSPQSIDAFKHTSAYHLSLADQVVLELEKGHAALKEIRFDKMRDAKAGTALHGLAQSANLDHSEEWDAFTDRVRQAGNLDGELSQPAASERAAYEAALRLRDAINTFAKETQAINAFSPAIEELQKKRERAEAAALLALLHPRESPSQHLPPLETALVKERLAQWKPADAVAAKTISDAKKLMNAWEAAQTSAPDKLASTLRDARAAWPEWLVKQAEARLAKTRADSAPTSARKPAATNFSTTPLYFLNGFASLKEARFPELERGMTFQLRTSPDANPTPLIDPTRLGAWRAKISEPALFTVSEAGKQITAERAGDSLVRPFVLIAKSAAGQDVMQLWFTNESDKPLFPKKSGGISRSGSTLMLDPTALALPGTPKSRMNLRVPDSGRPVRGKDEPLPVKDWSVDLAPLVEEFARSRKEMERRTKTFENTGAPSTAADAAARFKELKQVIADAVAREINDWTAVELARARRESDEKKRAAQLWTVEVTRKQKLAQAETDFGKDSDLLFQQAGGCIKAFCGDAAFTGHDRLANAGAALSFLKSAEDSKALAQAFAAAKKEGDLALRNLLTSEERRKYTTGLRSIVAIVTLLSPETPDLKTERVKSAGQLAAKQEALRRIDAHPLMSETVPPGVYRLSVFADGVEIPLMEIEIAR